MDIAAEAEQGTWAASNRSCLWQLVEPWGSLGFSGGQQEHDEHRDALVLGGGRLQCELAQLRMCFRLRCYEADPS